MSDTVDLKKKSISRDKEQYVMIKRSVSQEDLTILSVCVPNNRAWKCMKAKFDQKEMHL